MRCALVLWRWPAGPPECCRLVAATARTGRRTCAPHRRRGHAHAPPAASVGLCCAPQTAASWPTPPRRANPRRRRHRAPPPCRPPRHHLPCACVSRAGVCVCAATVCGGVRSGTQRRAHARVSTEARAAAWDTRPHHAQHDAAAAPAASSSSSSSAPGSMVAKPDTTSSSPTFMTAAVPCDGGCCAHRTTEARTR
jgi:hypothetical protein